MEGVLLIIWNNYTLYVPNGSYQHPSTHLDHLESQGGYDACDRPANDGAVGLGGNSIGKFRLQFRLEKRIEIPF